MRPTATFAIFILGIITSCGSIQNTSVSCEPQTNLQEIYSNYAKAKKPLAKINFDAPLNPEWVQTDFLVFRKILEESNPNIYRYSSRRTMDSLFEAKACQLKDSVSYTSFIQTLSEVYSTMACGHSSWGHTNDYYAYRKHNVRLFPLKIFVEKDKIYVKQNFSGNDAISIGDEIVTINGKSPLELNVQLEKYVYRDGQSQNSPLSEIAPYFENAYSNFIGSPDEYSLSLRKNDGTILETTIRSKSKDQLKASMSSYNHEKELGVPLRFSMDKTLSSATYTIKWFRNEYMDQFNQNFNTFTDSVFQEIKQHNVQHLIIDLRGNKGGWTANGKKLLSYLIDKPQPYIKRVEFNTIGSFSFQPIVISDRQISDTMKFKQTASGSYEWMNYPSLFVAPAEQNRFSGDIYVLIDRMSRSCSGIFSALLQERTSAIFIGEENGSAQCGQGGMVVAVQLPYTGIIVTSSTAKYSTGIHHEKSARGVQVDHFVPYSWKAYSQQHDDQMEFVRELIKKSP